MLSQKLRFLGKTFFTAGAALFLVVSNGLAQESSSKGSGAVSPAPALATPATALRDALFAACSQDQANFAHFLTARNQAAFSALTPPARVALMKRFVLLNVPGKASVSTNPSGRPIVRCETSAVTTEMKIGGVDLQDNLAFLPLELRDAADSTGANVHQISMGLVRENGQWKLLSLGVLFLDLPALEVEWDAEQMEATEHGAIEDLKRIADAVELYRRTYSRLPDSLPNLGPPERGKPNADAAGLVDSDLAAGRKDGYTFRYVIVGASTLGAPAKYELAATPLTYGQTGRRSFFRDASGILHGGDHQGTIGRETDPKIE